MGSGGSVQPAGIQQALLVIHILISLGGSPPASTFLLLSNSGTAWDQWFLLLRFLSVLAVNPGPPGDQRALGHPPPSWIHISGAPARGWVSNGGLFSASSAPTHHTHGQEVLDLSQATASRLRPGALPALGGTRVAPRLVTGSRQDLRCSHVSRWFPCAYRRG